MATEPIKFPMSGGLDRSKASHLSAPEDFYDLMNFRPSRDEEGALEQTPYFKAFATVSAGVGSTFTESSGNSMEGMFPLTHLQYLGVTKDAAHLITSGSSTQLSVYIQSSTVTATGLTAGCMATALGLSLGDVFQVEMTGTATFRHRINAGAWVTGVSVVKGGQTVSTGQRIVFLAATGYTTNDTWSWTRTDTLATSAVPAATITRYQTQFVRRGNFIYFLGRDTRLWKYIIDSNFIISAGYLPVYGAQIIEFANHLIVGRMTTTNNGLSVFFGANNAVGWSDRGDFDCFIPSDLNEADAYTFPALLENVYPVLGVYTNNNLLYVFTDEVVYRTSYLGLPVVFNFTLLTKFSPLLPSVNTYRNWFQTVTTFGNFALIYTEDTFYLFDGSSFQDIGGPIAHVLPNSGQNAAFAYAFVSQYQEIVFLSGTRLFCYSIPKKLWYSRNVDFSQGTPNALGVNYYGDTLLLGLSARAVVVEDVAWSGTPLKDYNAGASFTLPLARKHLYNAGTFYKVKELTGQTFLSTRVDTSPTSGYYTNADVFVNIFFRRIPHTAVEMKMPAARELIDANNATWNNAGSRNIFPGPRYVVRAFAFELELAGFDATKPPGKVFLYDIETELRTSAQSKR